MYFYVGFWSIYCMIYAGFSTYAHDANHLTRSINIYSQPNRSYFRFFIGWVIFTIGFITSVFYACKKLCSKGVSVDARQKILSRHVAYMVFFLLSSLYPALNSMLSFKFFWNKYRSEDFTFFESPYVSLLKITFQCQGFFMPVLRTAEPFFYKKLLTKLNPCKEKKSEEEDEYEE